MKISATQFKAKCLRLMDDVKMHRTEFTVTKRGKAIAKLIPFTEQHKKTFYGFMKGSAREMGDIVSPLDVQWDTDQ